MAECSNQRVLFQPHGRQEVTAAFDGGRVTSDGGGLLLREVEERFGIVRSFAGCFTDHRDPEATEFNLVFGGTAGNGRELAVITRSILQIMTTMAGQVEAPEKDVTDGRATPGLESVDGETPPVKLVSIQSSSGKPDDAFVAVNYRDAWFWIADTDLKSKRSFSFMLMLFTLADTGQKESMPLITIPAQ